VTATSGPLLSNPRADRVRAVRRLAGRSARRREQRFVAEGPQAVREAVTASAQARARGGPPVVLDLYGTPQALLRHPDVAAAARAAGTPVRTVTDEVLAAMADTVTPQGLLAVCASVDVPLAQVLSARPRLVAVLSHVRDPGNAGTVLRAADAAGAEAVVLTDASVDVHNPKCVRATAGSLFHLPVVAGVPLDAAAPALRAAGLLLLAADSSGEHDLDDLLDAAALGPGAAAQGGPPSLAGPVAWVFGNEAWGLPEHDRAQADASVRVPVHGRAESLNLAAAATVCLYATARAQRGPGGCRRNDPDVPETPGKERFGA
jgi:RNA methyltransferase, TrmH family